MRHIYDGYVRNLLLLVIQFGCTNRPTITYILYHKSEYDGFIARLTWAIHPNFCLLERFSRVIFSLSGLAVSYPFSKPLRKQQTFL